eukprot:Pgem_evm1s6571
MKDKNIIGSASVDYLYFSGFNMMGYMWLKMADAALTEKANPNREHPENFYDAKLETAEFFFTNLFPQAEAHALTMLAPTSTVMKMPVENFQIE